ncbi:MAG: right-handed parallel beta-helix repeat-containing protein [Candidatus Sumerlaeota bacterium]|nr:right-handed parallel beta-helix repeat-containing protein [Candidatus Sumerlaeota bacterium]
MKCRLGFADACFASLIGFLQCVCACGETIVVTPEKPEVPATLQPGDTVVFKDGVYKRKFSFADLAGAANAPIVIRSETPGGAVFDGSEPISLAWRKKGDLFIAASDAPPHALYRNGEFMRHLGDAKSLQPGTYNVSGAGPWTVTYRPLAEEDPASLQFSRGVMESAFSFNKCSYVILEGFRIVRFGMEKPPTNKFGITKFGGNVIGAIESRNVTLRGLTIDGFFSVGVNIGRCNDTVVEDTAIRNGYGAAIAINSDTAITNPSYLYRNNAARGCTLSNIYRFNKSQAGYSTKGIGVNGNQIVDTVIERCVLHSIPPTAIHFDVRSGFATVRNCLFFNNGGNMEIHLENRIHDVVIENNVFADSHCGSTIKYGRCWNIVLQHNTFYRTCGYNLLLEAAYNFTI